MSYYNLKEIIENMKSSHSIALVNFKDEQLSYKDLFIFSSIVANKLKHSSTNVIMLLPNDFSFVISLFASWFAGKTVIPLGEQLTDAEISVIAQHCNADTIIMESADNNRELTGLHRIVLTEHLVQEQKDIHNNYENYESNYELELEYNPLALILPTTGTSSNPKYVELTHANILSALTGIAESFELEEGSCELIIGPLRYVASLIAQLLVVLYHKGKLVIYQGAINPVKIAKLIKQYEVVYSGATASLAKIVFNNASAEDLASLKGLVMGGEPVTKSFTEELANTLPNCRIMQCYGMTETCSMITGYVGDGAVPLGSAGKPMPHIEIAIIDENGEECPTGTRGQIVVKGDCVTKGYYKNPTMNAVTFVNDWFRTGDLGMFDEQGYLYVLGRIKNMLIVGGQNVYPEEIEECLLSHQDVQNAFVYGVKHEVLGEAPIAKVVLVSGASVTEKMLYIYCKERLSSFKIPKQILFEEQVELNATGKQVRIKQDNLT
jgi:acyl-CoA synthetase (AMP-forming)/AMP-acid ligase II